jgi:hypothetical protein
VPAPTQPVTTEIGAAMNPGAKFDTLDTTVFPFVPSVIISFQNKKLKLSIHFSNGEYLYFIRHGFGTSPGNLTDNSVDEIRLQAYKIYDLAV